MFRVELLPRNLEACRRDITHADPKVRLSVVRDLARGGSEEDRQARLELLFTALSDTREDVRRQALVALADLRAHEARDRVLALLCDAQISVRQMAVMCLGEIVEEDDDEAVGRLASLMRAGDPSIRYQALVAHSHLRPEEAAADLLSALSDEDPEIRELAVRLVDEVLVASARTIEAPLQSALIAACEDEEPGVRLVAQLLCGDLRWEAPRTMIEAVVARRFRVREPRDEQTALELAGKLGLSELEHELVRRAFGRLGFSLDPFRWAALTSLCRLGNERAFHKLKGALRSKNAIDRAMAVQSLGDSGHPEALPLLVPLEADRTQLDPQILREALAKLRQTSTS